MMKRFVRSTLALLLCCALLMSNLGFAQELTELAEELAPAEPAVEVTEPAPEPEAEPEQAAEPEPEPEPEAEPQGEAEPGEAEPHEEGEVCEHQWSEGEEPYCVLCGKSDFCEHPEAERKTVFSCPAGTGTDNGDGTHAATYFGEEYMYCEDCGAIWARESTGETKQAAAEAHIWETRDGATFCGICGAEQPEGTEAPAEDEEEAEEVVEEEPAPELIVEIAPEEAVIEEEALTEESADAVALNEVPYEGESDCLHDEIDYDDFGNPYCKKCGRSETCAHNATLKTDDEAWLDAQPKADDPTKHTITVGKRQYMDCSICGARWDEKEAEDSVQTQTTFDDFHYWDADGKVCKLCGAVNQCTNHEADGETDERGWMYEPVLTAEEANENTSNAEGHRVWCVKYSAQHCKNCGIDMRVEEPAAWCEGQHEYNEGDNQGTDPCLICGYVSDCSHEHTERRTNESYDGVEAEDLGNGEHRGIWVKVESVYCLDCGLSWGRHLLSEEVKDEEHRWNISNGRRCYACDAINTCDDHVGVENGDLYLSYENEENLPEVVSTEDGDEEHTPKKEGHYLRGYGYQPMKCDNCGAEWEDDIEEAYVLCGHDWNDKGTACLTCGYTIPEEECQHKNWYWDEEAGQRVPFDAVEPDDEHAPKDLMNGQHEVWGVLGKERYCPDCDMRWGFEPNDGEVEHWITEDHDFNGEMNEEGKTICWICGSVNPCDHPANQVETHEWDELDYDTAEKLGLESPIVDEMNVKQHTVYLRHVTERYCNKCNVVFERTEEPLNNGEPVTEDHDWDSGDDGTGPIVCSICGHPNSCEHLGAKEVRDEYDNVRREFIPNDDGLTDGDEYQDEEGKHAVRGKLYVEMHCDDCGADYRTFEDNYLEVGEHEWENELNEEGRSYCRICGYVNTCSHASEYEEEWDEIDYDDEVGDPVISYNALGCEVRIRHVKQMRCPNCDATWDWHVEYIWNRRDDHEWDYDDGGQSCRWCGEENTCKHIDNLDADYVDIFNEGYFTKEDEELGHGQIDGEAECNAKCTHWIEGYCSRCDSNFRFEDDEYEYHGEHQWNDVDGKTCALCGLQNVCQHDDPDLQTKHRFVSRNDDMNDEGYEDGVCKADENGHEIAFCVYEETICESCGLHYGVHEVIDGFTNQNVKDYLAADGIDVEAAEVEVDTNTSTLWSKHIWNGEDGGYECLFCGWENSCEHRNTEDLGQWYDWVEGRSEYNDEASNEDHHVFEHVVAHYRVYCHNCNTEIVFTDDDAWWEEEHHIQAQVGVDGTVQPNAECDDDHCEYTKTCSHPASFQHTEQWWELAEGEDFTKRDETGHSGMLQEVKETYCDQCGAAWNRQVVTSAEEKTLPHEKWYFNDEDGKVHCGVCDFVSTCDHADRELVETWYDLEGATVSKKTATTHTMKNVYKVKLFHCKKPECDAFYEARTKSTYSGEHEWDGENGAAAKCGICGYANPCKHPVERVEFTTWFDPDMERGGIVSVDNTGHTMYAMQVGEYHCFACDARWGWQILDAEYEGEEESGTVKEPHQWNDEGRCNICMYSLETLGACKHSSKELVNDWYEFAETKEVLAKTATAKGHTGTATHMQEYYCPDCGYNWTEAVGEPQENYLAEHEWDDGNGAKTCWVCGYTNPCKHPASMVTTETWEEPDVDGYPNGGVVVSGEEGCTVYVRTVQESFCEQCGMHYGWKVVKSGYKRSGEHEWDFDNDTGELRTYCKWCERPSKCKHDSCEPLGEEYEDILEDSDPEKFKKEEETHNYKVYTWELKRCNTCGLEFETRKVQDPSDYKTFKEPHDWQWVATAGEGGTGAPVCRICGYISTCKHTNRDLNESVWYDVDGLKGGIISSNSKGHTGWFFEVRGYYCPDCDANINVVTGADSKKMTRSHEWSYDEDGAFCVICGYKNSCKHAKATVTDEWFEIYKTDTRNSAKSAKTADRHAVYGTHVMEMYCPTCKASYRVNEEDYLLKGLHEWTWDDSQESAKSVCSECGYENPCPHENTEQWSWLELDRTREVVRDKDKHTVYLAQATQKHCLDCGIDYDYQLVSLGEQQKDAPHEWNEYGYCKYCDWKNPCTKHKSYVKYTTTGLPEKMQIVNRGVTGHTVIYVTYNENYCKTCGAYLSTTEKAGSQKQITEAHVFGGENGDVCELCGWKNTCMHPDAKKETKTIAYGDQYAYRGADGHVVYGDEYTIMHCERCDAYWGYEVTTVGKKLSEEAVPHTWDSTTGKFCVECGFENTCKHPSTRRTTQVKDQYTVLDQFTTLEEHTIAHTSLSYTHCNACNADYGYKSLPEEVTVEDHDFSESESKCTVCGFVSSTERTPISSLSFEEASIDGVGDAESPAVILGVGEKYVPLLKKEPDSATDKITYATEEVNTKKISVDEKTGMITARSAGTVKLIASGGDHSATLTVKVVAKPTSISLSAKTMTLGMEDSGALTATFKPNGSVGHVTWTSSDSNVAEYDEATGTVKAKGLGTAIITATVYSNKSASCTVTVLEALSKDNVELDFSLPAQEDGGYHMATGDSTTATVRLINSYGNYTVVSSDEAATVTLEKNGAYKVTAADEVEDDTPVNIQVKKVNAAGEAEGGALAEKQITIHPEPASLEFDKDSLPANNLLGVHEDWQLKVIAKTAEDGNYDSPFVPTFTSSKPAVLAVEANSGVLTAKKAGSAKISVKVGNCESATVQITVKKAPTSIKLDKKTLEMFQGGTDTLKATLSSGSAGSVKWFSDNNSVVKVENGQLTAEAPGIATVTASVYNSKDASKPLTAMCPVTVYAQPVKNDMEIIPSKEVLGNGETIKYTTEYIGKNAGGKFDIRAVDEDETVTTKAVKIDKNKCTIKGLVVGKVKIQAVYESGDQVIVRAEKTIDVKAAPTAVAFKKIVYEYAEEGEPVRKEEDLPKAVTLTPGDGFEFKPVITKPTVGDPESDLTVTSSKDSVVHIEPNCDRDGKPDGTYTLYAQKAGSATITVKTYLSKVKATCKVTVKKSPTSLTLSKTELEMIYDDEDGTHTTKPQTIKATLKPSGCGGTVEWESSDTSVAEVNNGKITAKSVGKAFITARVHNYDGDYDLVERCLVRVCEVPKENNIRLVPEKNQIGEEGGTTMLHLEYSGSAGSIKAYSYKVASPADGSIVTVDSKTGKVTAKKGQAGKTAQVQVTMFNGLVVKAEIEVLHKPDSIAFFDGFNEEDEPDIYEEHDLMVGASLNLELLFNTNAGDGIGSTADVTWTTSNKRKVSLDADDVKNKNPHCTITGVAEGTAIITAKTHNKKTATVKINVSDPDSGHD